MTDAYAIQEGRTDRTGAFQDPRFRGSWSGLERDCLFVNARGPKFYDSGHAFALDFGDDGRAVAPVDIDGDGDLDLAFLSLQGLRLMENRSAPRRFARLRLEAAKGDRQALGARVHLEAGGVTQQDYVKATTGFATQVPLDLHFGLAEAKKIDAITIRWPDGSSESHRDLPVDRLLVIRQGSAPVAQELPRWAASSRPRVEGQIKMKAIGRGTIVYQVGGLRQGPGSSKARFLELSPEDSLAKSLKADAPSTFIFDSEGRLRRAFYRPVDDREIAAVVDHLGRGKFHSDLVAVATYHLSRHEYEPADKALTRALEIEPKFAIGWYYLGHLRGFQDRHADAVEAFRTAVNLDPYYREARHNLGVALYKSRKLSEAAEALREALKLKDSAETRHVLGQVLAESGKLDDAVTEIRRALELDPKRARAHGDLGKILLAMGLRAQAEASLRKALEIDPNLAEARLHLEQMQGR